MKTRILSLALAAFLLFGMTACDYTSSPIASDNSQMETPTNVPSTSLLPSIVPDDSEAETAPMSPAAYRAYYDILKAAVDECGFGVIEQHENLPNLYSGVIHAELIDFNNDRLPEFLYVYADDSLLYGAHIAVYEYNSDSAELLGTFDVWPTHVGADIDIDQYNFAYLHHYSLYSFDSEDSYYTLIDGKWTSALELSSTSDDFDELDEWFVNGSQVHKHDYYNALETLCIVSSRQLWWGGRGVDLDTIHTLLAELDRRASSIS